MRAKKSYFRVLSSYPFYIFEQEYVCEDDEFQGSFYEHPSAIKAHIKLSRSRKQGEKPNDIRNEDGRDCTVL